MLIAAALLLSIFAAPQGAVPATDVLPYAQVASGSIPASDVLSGRVKFESISTRLMPSYVWIRLHLSGHAAAGGRWVLFLPTSVDIAHVYIPHGRGYAATAIGTGVSYAAHPDPYLPPAVDLDAATLANPRPIYIHVHYVADTPFFIRIVPEADAIVTAFDDRLVQGLFFGVLLAVALCNLYVAVTVRVRTAALLVGYIVAFFINEVVATGLGAQYLWPYTAPDNRALTLLSNTMVFLMGLLFTRSFLRTRDALPNWDRALIAWFVAEVAVDTLRHALPNGLVLAPLLLAIQLGGMLITIGAGIMRIRQGFAPARLFVLAFAPAIVGYISNLAYDIYLPAGRWFFARNGVEFGSMFESLIFTFSLLDRIRTLDEANLKLRTIVARDTLTGLYNRAKFFEDFEHEIALAERTKRGLGVLYIDLDGFKNVNDAFGHRTGDLLLQVVARRLRTAVRDSDLIARLGGDEFAVLVSNVTAEQLEAVRTEVAGLAQTPITVEGRVVGIGVSVGAALYPRDGVEADRLIEVADHAMYAVKQARTQAVGPRGSTTTA